MPEERSHQKVTPSSKIYDEDDITDIESSETEEQRDFETIKGVVSQIRPSNARKPETDSSKSSDLVKWAGRLQFQSIELQEQNQAFVLELKKINKQWSDIWKNTQQIKQIGDDVKKLEHSTKHVERMGKKGNEMEELRRLNKELKKLQSIEKNIESIKNLGNQMEGIAAQFHDTKNIKTMIQSQLQNFQNQLQSYLQIQNKHQEIDPGSITRGFLQPNELVLTDKDSHGGIRVFQEFVSQKLDLHFQNLMTYMEQQNQSSTNKISERVRKNIVKYHEKGGESINKKMNNLLIKLENMEKSNLIILKKLEMIEKSTSHSHDFDNPNVKSINKVKIQQMISANDADDTIKHSRTVTLKIPKSVAIDKKKGSDSKKNFKMAKPNQKSKVAKPKQKGKKAKIDDQAQRVQYVNFQSAKPSPRATPVNSFFADGYHEISCNNLLDRKAKRTATGIKNYKALESSKPSYTEKLVNVNDSSTAGYEGGHPPNHIDYQLESLSDIDDSQSITLLDSQQYEQQLMGVFEVGSENTI
ncbi:hypothetical protein DASC09_018150 [Saccharomycopsis crataegensis]|uniref:Uncharacterized protein n=1 Tax=Saccharomycopsis crataegensis TaxID=43959 RepID=A0AAV5QJE2_9ASCO|nr:hypothetical protein DASC09_018150 [Saccharomycopsis crataegensis]